MALEAAAAASTVAALPLTAAPVLQALYKSLKPVDPRLSLAVWTDQADAMLDKVLLYQKFIPANAMAGFLGYCKRYVRERNQYLERVNKGEYKGRFLSKAWRKEIVDRREVIKASRSTADSGRKITSTGQFTMSRCLAEHGPETKDENGRCVICRPLALETARLVRRATSDDHYTAEWYGMEEVQITNVQLEQECRTGINERQVSDCFGDASQTRLSVRQQLETDFPPSYSTRGPAELASTVNVGHDSQTAEAESSAGPEAISNEEVEDLIFCYLNDVPHPAEVNAWASVADFRDILLKNFSPAPSSNDWS
ncbi:hypothetical protein CPC08DRAFT_716568 [Agrocybe pediades]|nr:hypothetical protein CPC08DRAFT_716568 [Agrocybe pediades]